MIFHLIRYFWWFSIECSSTSDNTIRIINHRFVQGQRVVYSNGGGGNINGLTANAYYIIKDSPHTLKLAANESDALV